MLLPPYIFRHLNEYYESEFKAVANVCVEIKWLSKLLKELGVQFSQPPHVWCDNDGVVFLSTNPVFHTRTRHVEKDFHFVRATIANSSIVLLPSFGFSLFQHQLVGVYQQIKIKYLSC
eukprot:XP_025013003.1 uncharacterized protein LOC8280948 [Ricinus communis]